MGNYNVNPVQLIQAIKNGQNPQQLLMNIMENNMASTPMGANLLNLAKNNKTEEIEMIARNIMREKGVNYDQAMNQFKQMLGGLK